jgi:hypothetical protein
MLYVFLWLLCALIAGYVYHNKGRPWLWGALAGLVFGPIGVILALITVQAKN